MILDKTGDGRGEIRTLRQQLGEDAVALALVVCRQCGAESDAVGEEYVVTQPTMSETFSDLVDPSAQFLMCLRELPAQGDHSVASAGSH